MKPELRELATKIISGIAVARDLEAASLDDVRAIKRDQDGPHFRVAEFDVKAADGEADEHSFEWVASTEHVDSMGDIIRVAGWDTKRLTVGRCPLLLNHSPHPGPAGLLKKAKRARMDDGVKALCVVGRFHEDDLYGDSEYAKILTGHRKLVARGELIGCSVGFMPADARYPEDEEREALGMPKYGLVFERQELLELSVTCIPANANANRKSAKAVREAMRSMVASGEIAKEVAETLLSQVEDSSDAFWKRRDALQRELVPVGDLPWLRGAKAPDMPAATKSADVLAIEAATSKAVEEITRAVGRETSRVIREAIAPLEASMQELVERVEDAVTQLDARDDSNSERGEGREVRGPDGSQLRAAPSTGMSRENPNPLPHSRMSAVEALLRAVDAAPIREGTPDGGQAHD